MIGKIVLDALIFWSLLGSAGFAAGLYNIGAFWNPPPRLMQSTAQRLTPSSTTITLSIPSTNRGDFLVLSACHEGSNQKIVSISDNASNSYSSANCLATQPNGQSEIWYAPSLKAGTTTLTITLANTDATDIWASEYYGILNSNPLDGTASGTSGGGPSTTVTAPAIVTSSAQPVVISVGCVQQSITAISAPFIDFGLQNGNGTAYYLAPKSGTYQAVWNQSSSAYWCTSTAAFKSAR
jgi:hypothetical protein